MANEQTGVAADRQAVADSMDAAVELVDHLPELFADLEDLGARTADVATILAPHPLQGRRVLDLGCGKGAAAIELAKTRGARVRGVDALPAFVAHARAAAETHDVADRCDFAVGDIAAEADRAREYDLVMLLALGDALGDLTTTVARLRRTVRAGGAILIDDAYLAPGVDPDAAGLQACLPHHQALEALQSHGDTLIAEHRFDTDAYRTWCWQMTTKILQRAESLATRHPNLREAALAFAHRQRQETTRMTTDLVSVMWLLRVT